MFERNLAAPLFGLSLFMFAWGISEFMRRCRRTKNQAPAPNALYDASGQERELCTVCGIPNNGKQAFWCFYPGCSDGR